jgi:hypothetical protein
VVVVLVREEDGRDGFGGDAARLHPPLDLAGGEAGVDENARLPRLDHATRCLPEPDARTVTRTGRLISRGRRETRFTRSESKRDPSSRPQARRPAPRRSPGRLVRSAHGVIRARGRRRARAKRVTLAGRSESPAAARRLRQRVDAMEARADDRRDDELRDAVAAQIVAGSDPRFASTSRISPR